MIRILAEHRIDHYAVNGQTFLNDPHRHRCALNALFFTPSARALFALRHYHEVLVRLDVQLLAQLVADHTGFFTALAADTLLWSAADELFNPGQVRRQLLTARMLSSCFERQLEL